MAQDAVLQDTTKDKESADIWADQDVRVLPTLTVSSDIGVTKLEPAKVVYKAADLPSQQGGSAGDLLKGMPSVAMGGSPGHNRDVRFRGLGNGYTKVLINGRPTGITGNNRETVLDQIPVSSIERIEVLPAPTADYSGEGLNGIINIILKQPSEFGVHGQVGASADDQGGYSAQVGVSAKGQKLEGFVRYDRLMRQLDKDKTADKTNLKAGVPDSFQAEAEREDRSFTNDLLKAGLRYRPMERTVVGMELLYGHQTESKDKTKQVRTTLANGNFKDAQRQQEQEDKYNDYFEYYGELKHRFRSGGQLSANLQLLQGQQHKDKLAETVKLDAQGQVLAGNPTLQREREEMGDDNLLSNLQYEQMLGKTYLKTGYAYSRLGRDIEKVVEKYDHKTGSWTPANGVFTRYALAEQTQAAFVMGERQLLPNLRMTAGLRLEHTHLQSRAQEQSLSHDSYYLLLLPSAGLTYHLDSLQYLTFSFGKRVRRPGFQDLNPFEDNTDPLKVKLGNPSLRPEYTYAYELGYMRNFKHFSLGANVFYRDIRDLIQKQVTEDAQNVVYEQPINLSGAYLAGAELLLNARPFHFWEFNASFSYFDSRIRDEAFEGDAIKDQMVWMGKMIHDVHLPWKLDLQMTFNWLGPKAGNSQEEEERLFFADMGLQRDFGRYGKGFLRATDVFGTLQKQKQTRTDKSWSQELERANTRTFTIGYQYSF